MQGKNVTIFIILSTIFGLIMLFLSPQFGVPDEYFHFLRTNEIAYGFLWNNPNNIWESYQIHGASGYSPLMYFASALGYKIGLLFNQEIAFYLGRFFNLLLWIIVVSFSISITPIYKQLFTFIALLPMSVQLSASYSADVFNNAFIFLFFAIIFKYIFDKKTLLKKDYIILIILSVISAFTKASFYPIFLFLFLPTNKRIKITFTIMCLFMSLQILSWWSTLNYSFLREENKLYLIENPISLTLTTIKSMIIKFPYYVRSGIGYLCYLDVKLNPIAYLITVIFFFIQIIIHPVKNLPKNIKLLSFFVASFIYVSTHILLYLTWNIPDTTIIKGVQGRYFIPLLPFIFIILTQPACKLHQKLINRIDKATVLFIFLLLLHASYLLYTTPYILPKGIIN